ncbi:MAG TPA: lysylphosphatidylglycerol synthase transmembrane domain-containing protein [Ktedonobacteraceae bacterium]|nr:lysylphosphatidylglycerol synthase transmembrane domain-containing protein [Ktedonobacteraceae bacterium]
MSRSSLKNIGKRVLQIGLPIIILASFAFYVRGEWNLLTKYTFRWNPWLMLLAFAGFALQEISYGLIWRAVLLRLGYRLDLRACLRIYLASEFVRYMPGNVWHVLTRILWVAKYGVPRPVAFASMTIELITKLAAGALVFALSLLFWGDSGAVWSLVFGKPFVAGLGGVIILALLVGLHPRVLGWFLNIALRLLKRNSITLTMRYSDILLVTLAWSGSWLVAGSAFYVLLLALFPNVPLAALPICIGIYAIGWDIGFVSFLTPSGLGFREGAIAGLLALSLPTLPLVWGSILAIVSRFVSTLAELVCVSIAYLSGGRQMRAVREEQADLSNPPVLK